MNSSSQPSSVMEQYAKLKAEAGDKLVLFQMGEFYEIFYEDAEIAANALALTLTKRGFDKNNRPIPMCGIPVHTANHHLIRLLRQGFQIAICEQTELPEEARKKRGYKTIVDRQITRIVTPATLIEEDLIESTDSLYLASFGIDSKKRQTQHSTKAIAWADISTGKCFYSTDDNYETLLRAIDAKEILLPESVLPDQNLMEILAPFREKLRPWPDQDLHDEVIERQICETFSLQNLDIIGSPQKPARIALYKLCHYLCQNLKTDGVTLTPPKEISSHEYMKLGGMVHQHLELLRSAKNTKKGSLLATIDHTKTAQGHRLLAQRLAMPLCHLGLIQGRQQRVGFLVTKQELRKRMRELLTDLPDMERAMARLGNQKANPKDLGSIVHSLQILKTIQRDLTTSVRQQQEKLWTENPALFEALLAFPESAEMIHHTLLRALEVPPPAKIEVGQVIRSGYANDLDMLRQQQNEQKRNITLLEREYQNATGIESLKIKHNQNAGYFIEFTTRHAKKDLPDTFQHRQNLSHTVRYTTQELEKLNTHIATSAQHIQEKESSIFQELCQILEKHYKMLIQLSDTLSEMDWTCAMAELARKDGYVCPKLVEEKGVFDIEQGWHPVVEYASKKQKTVFTRNDCHLNPQDRIWLLSGPNMAGKSTFLRQNAIVAILAHMGSFVPAKRAHMSVLNSIFSRLGASDDITQGLSTFMVEMLDISAILHQAGPQSLVILDEVGRGTATYDGMAIAWATLEYLHDQLGTLCIFATHYHELATLAHSLKNLSNHTMKIEEHKNRMIFFHQVMSGASYRSYGIHVAALANLPQTVVQRAFEVLANFERQHSSDSLPLFASLPHDLEIKKERTQQKKWQELAENITELDLNAMSPKQALDLLYELQHQVMAIGKD